MGVGAGPQFSPGLGARQWGGALSSLGLYRLILHLYKHVGPEISVQPPSSPPRGLGPTSNQQPLPSAPPTLLCSRLWGRRCPPARPADERRQLGGSSRELAALSEFLKGKF